MLYLDQNMVKGQLAPSGGCQCAQTDLTNDELLFLNSLDSNDTPHGKFCKKLQNSFTSLQLGFSFKF